MSYGSVATFCSSTTLPASSTTHTAVSFTDTSSPTKCAMPSLLPSMPEVSCDLASIVREGAADSRSQIAPQPPRYTIFSESADRKQTDRLRPTAVILKVGKPDNTC